MTLARLARFFVAPPAEMGEAEAVRWMPPAPAELRRIGATRSVGIVCGPRDARPAGGAAALALAHVAGARRALVVVWTGEEQKPLSGVPSSRPVRRLAAETGGDAFVRGRLAWIALPADEAEAAARASEVLRRSAGPAVLVVAGPRGSAMDELLAEQGRTLLAGRPGDDDAVTELAAERLGAEVVVLPASPGAAALARAGLALVSPLRRLLLEAVGGR